MACELLLIASIRKRYQRVSLRQSLMVTLGGTLVAAVGIALGHS